MTEPLPVAFQIETLLTITEQPAPVVGERILYRVKHDKELYGRARDEVIRRGVPLPEVQQLKPVHFTPLTWILQILIRDINPLLTGREVRKLLGCHRAFTNNAGFDCSEGKHGPFRDYINMRDLDADELPKLESIICGGATVSGVEAVERGERVLWLETIDPDNIPNASEVLATRWLRYEAVAVRPDGGVQSFSITPHREFVPLVANQPVYIEMSKLTRQA